MNTQLIPPTQTFVAPVLPKPHIKPVSMLEEDELLSRATEFDERAIAEIYARYEGKIYAFLYRRVGEEALAEDLTAQVFLKMLEAIRNGHTWRTSFSGWLYRIAHNLLVDTYRRQRPEVELDETTLPVEDDGPTPEQELSVFERRRRLQMAIDELPEEQRAVVDLRLRQELTLEEIAEIAGVGRETIKSRLRYAMDKLRGRLRA